MTAHINALLLCVCAVRFIAPTCADKSRSPLLRGGQQQRLPMAKSNQSASSLKVAVKWDNDPWNWIQNDGVLIKMLDIKDTDFDNVDVLGDEEIMNDCREKSMGAFQDDLGIPDCSAWAFMKQGLVPMVYNYPPAFHQVGIVVAKNPAVTQKVTRMHVMDGITISRYRNGLDRDDNNNSPDSQCGEGTHYYRCSTEENFGPRYCGDSGDTLWAPVGQDGSSWPDQFIFSGGQVDFTRTHSNRGQCEFYNSDEEWGFFENALQSFYNKVKYLSDNDMLPQFDIHGAEDDKVFLENEVNMETPAQELKELLVSDSSQPLLAVIVQTNLCPEQVPDVVAQDWCPDEIKDAQNRDSAITIACRLQKQISDFHGLYVPVLGATGILTNSIPDASRWYHYQHETNDPSEWLPKEPIDCTQYLS